MHTIFVVLGPTSTGKTSLALDLCKKFDGEIVSADSRQIYKYMDVGTGKVSVNKEIKIKKSDRVWELDGIKVWGYDLVEPDKYFSAYDYGKFSLSKLEEILGRGKVPFLVGGTGFYIDTITKKIEVENVKPDFSLRKKLESLSLSELQKKVTSLNLGEFNESDWYNKVRLIRYIEKGLSKRNDSPLPYLQNVSYKYYGLTADRKILYERADLWLDEVWENGLIEETKSLLEKFPGSGVLQGLVYRNSVDYVLGNAGEADSKQKAKYDLHAYIRRQLTYFKRNRDIKWFDVSKDSFKQTVYNEVKLSI